MIKNFDRITTYAHGMNIPFMKYFFEKDKCFKASNDKISINQVQVQSIVIILKLLFDDMTTAWVAIKNFKQQ